MLPPGLGARGSAPGPLAAALLQGGGGAPAGAPEVG